MKAVIQNVKMELIDRPEDLARLEIQSVEIESLADSIRERGLQQPIKVARRDQRFKVIFGDRRFLAYQVLERKTILATVVDATDEEIAIDRAIENIQRVDLTPVEEALQYQGMIDKLGMNLVQVSRKVGKKEGTIKRRLDLLKFPNNFKGAVHRKQVSLTVAEELMACGDPAHRDYLLEMAVEHGITKDIARMWVQDWRKSVIPRGEASAGGGGGQALPFDKKSYIACGLCDGPVDVTEVKTITVCQDCLNQLYDMLHGKEPETGGG
ncbi:Nucleoid occlusion protein [subsurface metagenome]